MVKLANIKLNVLTEHGNGITFCRSVLAHIFTVIVPNTTVDRRWAKGASLTYHCPQRSSFIQVTVNLRSSKAGLLRYIRNTGRYFNPHKRGFRFLADFFQKSLHLC